MTTLEFAAESTALSPELRVLLDCGTRQLSTGEVSLADSRLEDANDLDWERVHFLSRQHGMEQLLTATFTDSSLDARPSELADRLEGRSTQLQARTLSMVAELGTLVESLAASGIPVLAYKGPVAASRAYGESGHRTFGDLDLLVAESDRSAALAVLETRGYERETVNGPVFQTVLRRPDESPAFEVDLHTRVIPDFFPFELPFGGLYDRRTTVEVSGRAVPTLSSEDALLVHSVHGSKHHWFRIEWILATAALAGRVDDLAASLARAGELGCERMVLLALELARRLFGAAFPAVQTRLDADSREMQVVRGAAADVLDWIANEEWADRNVERTHIADFKLRSRLLASPAAKTRFWSRALTKPRREDVEWVDLPPGLSPLYRVIRPVRLLVEYRRALGTR